MLYVLFAIGVFVLVFRWFAPESGVTTAASIPGVIISGLFAMNFFEPMGQWLWLNSIPVLGWEPDLICFLCLFLVPVFGLKGLSRQCLHKIRLSEPHEIRLRLGAAALVSYLTVSITLTACDTSPLMQQVLSLSPESAVMPEILRPDAQWLSLAALIEEGALARPMTHETGVDPQLAASADHPPRRTLRSFRQRFVPVALTHHP